MANSSSSSLRSSVVLLCAFAAGLAWRSLPTPAYAREGAPAAAFLVTAPGRGVGHNVVFMVDESSKHLLVYEHVAGGALTLTQARDYQFDTRLKEFPSPKDKKNPRRQKPSVDEIEQALKGK